MKTIISLIASLLLFAGFVAAHDKKPDSTKTPGLKVLVYSNTGYYRHPDIPKINRWLVLLGHENGFDVDVTEHWKDMQPEVLAGYDVLVLNNANELDMVLPEEQRKAVEEWFNKGKKGIVALHAVAGQSTEVAVAQSARRLRFQQRLRLQQGEDLDRSGGERSSRREGTAGRVHLRSRLDQPRSQRHRTAWFYGAHAR